MAKLIYTAITSLDGYVEDREGAFDWSQPDDEVHAFINDLERPVGTYLYGRRMYETMRFWETPPAAADPSDVGRDFGAIWRAADKVVYSRTLERVTTERTRVERELEPETVRSMKERAERDLSIGGAELGGQAIRAGLVDELHQFVTPVVVGGGKPFLPDGVRLGLELIDERRFANGVVHLHYRLAEPQLEP